MSKNLIYIKALDDWQLEVRGVPYGGPNGGRDADGEYFDASTNLHDDKFALPPVVYYHGFGPNGEPLGDPEFIGKTTGSEKRSDGVWYRVVLDKTSQLAQRVWQAAKDGLARASSGSINHLVRIAKDGHILHWPVAELSVFDIGDGRRPANGYAVALPVMKSIYKQAGIEMPEIAEPEANGGAGENLAKAASDNQQDETINNSNVKHMEKNKMDEKELKAQLEAAKAAGRAEHEAEIEAENDRLAEIEAAKTEAVKAYKEQQEKEAEDKEKAAAKGRRLPDNVTIAKHSELWKYDNLSSEDQAVLVGVLDAAKRGGDSRNGASESARKALAVKLAEDKGRVGEVGRKAMKAVGIKADEIQQQDLTSYGDEWVGVAYSQALWEAIRAGTFVAANLPSIEVPPGHESITIPLESGDPTFYKVAEVTDTQTSGWPNTTITSSQMGTAKKSLTLSKMGARVLWSGELEEDSLIPFVAQLRAQLEKAGAEQLEHAIIDGDTATAASTNINDIAATGAQAGTELHLLFNGFRKSPLVTTTANSRSAGALTVEDYLETVKLMGAAGLNAADVTKVAFIVDPNVYWKSLEQAELKTQDVWQQATLKDGMLAQLWGYDLYRSYFMHYKSAVRKANSSGKVDQDSTANNSTGSILAVRWDQWLLGFRRRMTMETTRIARADATEIVALARLGLAQRDTEAAAISYNVTV
jgi:hypothetical protein